MDKKLLRKIVKQLMYDYSSRYWDNGPKYRNKAVKNIYTECIKCKKKDKIGECNCFK